MKIMDFLSKKAVVTNLRSTKKEDILREMVDALLTAGEIEKRHRNKLIEALMARDIGFNSHWSRRGNTPC